MFNMGNILAQLTGRGMAPQQQVQKQANPMGMQQHAQRSMQPGGMGQAMQQQGMPGAPGMLGIGNVLTRMAQQVNPQQQTAMADWFSKQQAQNPQLVNHRQMFQGQPPIAPERGPMVGGPGMGTPNALQAYMQMQKQQQQQMGAPPYGRQMGNPQQVNPAMLGMGSNLGSMLGGMY